MNETGSSQVDKNDREQSARDRGQSIEEMAVDQLSAPGSMAKKISKAYSEAKSSVDLAIRKVIVCGLLLQAQKSRLKHGEFGRWLASSCPEISWKTACSWMKTARIACRENSVAPDSSFDSVPLYDALQSPPSKLSPAARSVRDRIFQFVDGRSQRSLTLSPKENNSPEKGETKQRELPESIRSKSTSVSKIEVKKLETQNKWKAIAQNLQLELQKKSFAFLDHSTLEEMHDLFKKTEAVLGELIQAQRKINN
jgi:hypothetical protein